MDYSSKLLYTAPISNRRETYEVMPAKSKVKKETKKKPVKTPVKHSKPTKTSSQKPSTMEELLKQTGYQLKGLKKGQKVKGVVTDVTKKMILIDIGAKTEGVVIDKEYELAREMLENLAVGDEVEAYVGSPENERGQILLSLRQAVMAQQAKALKHVKVGDELSGVVSGIMPFGVFVRANVKKLFLEGLVHISEISWEKVENPASFFKTGDKVKVKVIGV